MRIAFFGTPQPAVPALKALIDDHEIEVAVVVTNPDRPAGRGHKLTPPPVKVVAEEAGIAVLQPNKPAEILTQLKSLRLDACAVVAYGQILKKDVLEGASEHGFINLHFSLLPAWRGAAPVAFGIANGDTIGGVTCFKLDEGMDTGDILTIKEEPIGENETAGELTARLADIGAPELIKALKGLLGGTIEAKPQDDSKATYASKISSDDAKIDWSLPAKEIHNLVRAYNPIPGAHTTNNGDRLKIHETRISDQNGSTPGELLKEEDGFPVVACGDGSLLLKTVQPAGKPRMSGDAWVNGYQPKALGDKN